MFVIKRLSDGKYVARSGSPRSYINDRNQAEEYCTIDEARRNACVDSEGIYQSSRDELVVIPRGGEYRSVW